MLRENIKINLNEAIRSQNKKTISTLRLVLAAIKDRDIAARSDGNNEGISDDEIKLMLQTMIKQRKESAKLYENAGRSELSESENEEVLIIASYLPQQTNDIEINEAVRQVMSETNASSMRDMGKIMGILKERYAGRCDFTLVSKIAREILSSSK